jgi:catechol 2,3-dioxygenase-like lactoylglutathione lyase family enzyme
MVLKLLKAVPVLPSLDLERSVNFFVSKLGFEEIHLERGEYAIVDCDKIEIHFWACDDKKIPEVSSCRIEASDIAALYAHCEREKIVHPNGALADKPWGTKEFSVLDPDGNLITFFEYVED